MGGLAMTARVGLVLLAVVFFGLGMGGKLPHEWLGISTQTLVGWAAVGFLPVVFVTLQLVNVVQNRRIMRGIEYLVGQKLAPSAKVVPFKRRSG